MTMDAYYLNPANLWREVRDRIIERFWKQKMRYRNPEEELWVFYEQGSGRPRKPGGRRNIHIAVHPRPKSLPTLLVTLGLAASNGDAARLLKANAITQREWYGYDWWSAPSIVEGYPQWIRRGKKMYGVVTYMLPKSNQTEGLWLKLMNEPLAIRKKKA